MARNLLVLALIPVLLGCSTTIHEEEDSGKAMDVNEYGEPSPLVVREIQSRIEVLQYQSDELLYQNLQRLIYIGEPCIPFLVDALDDPSPRTRGSCAYVLGMLRDRRAIEPLREALSDDIPAVRYEVATALCALGVQDGYSALVEGLSDPDIRNRYKCHESLKLLTHLDFGYRHDDDPEERRIAITKWEGWLHKMEAAQL